MDSKILVPLDGSQLAEQVLPYVRLLAGVLEAPVELLRVTDPEARPSVGSSSDYLQKTAGSCLAGVKKVVCTEKAGKPAEVIVEEAKGVDCVIAMATHGTSGLRRWLLGSVASKVVQTARNPLLLVRPEDHVDPASASIALKTIFVPLDGSGLAEKALPHAVALAKRLKTELHLLRVFATPPEAYLVGDGVIAPAPEYFRQNLRAEAETYLDGKVQQLRAEGIERVIFTMPEGDPASEIIDLAGKTDNDLIVMSTHGRSGVGRWVLGSVAERVIQHARTPVLLIRAG